MASISTANRLAKSNADIPLSLAIGAIRDTVGPPGSADLATGQMKLFRELDAIAGRHEQDPSILHRAPPMKDGISMGDVHLLASKLIDLAALPGDAALENYDPTVACYMLQRLFIPALERMGFLEVSAVVRSNEERARAMMGDYLTVTRGTIQVTVLTRQILMQALDPVDPKVGSLPGDISIGLRIAMVQGAKEIAAIEPDLYTAVKNRQPIPLKFGGSEYAIKYTRCMLLRVLAPLVSHRLKMTCAIFCSVASVADVLLADNPLAPIVITVVEQKESFAAKRIRDEKK